VCVRACVRACVWVWVGACVGGCGCVLLRAHFCVLLRTRLRNSSNTGLPLFCLSAELVVKDIIIAHSPVCVCILSSYAYGDDT